MDNHITYPYSVLSLLLSREIQQIGAIYVSIFTFLPHNTVHLAPQVQIVWINNTFFRHKIPNWTRRIKCFSQFPRSTL